MRILLCLGLVFTASCTCNESASGPQAGQRGKMGKMGKKGKFKGRKGKRKNLAGLERMDATLWFVDQKKLDAGDEDFWVSVIRPVGAKTPAKNAVWQLFKGPTPEEAAQGLTLYKSGSEGFQNFSVDGSVATLQLRAGCSSEGKTTSIYDHLSKTLKSFPEITHVKLLDPDGATAEPEGQTDSRPACLEP